MCFDEPLEDLGPCRGGYSLPHGDVTHNPQWQDGVAIGGFVVAPLLGEESKEKHRSDEEKMDKGSIKFSPPMQIGRFCILCFTGKMLVIAVILLCILLVIRWIFQLQFGDP